MLGQRTVRFFVLLSIWTAALNAHIPTRVLYQQGARHTTETAQALVLERIEGLTHSASCWKDLLEKGIDLQHLRATAEATRFYDADGPEAYLLFSDVAGKPAAPDATIRDLAQELSDADAFVLGYVEDGRYIRTNHVVLNRGYFRQFDPQGGIWRYTTLEEKQDLLLHEILHIALDTDNHGLDILLEHGPGQCPLHSLGG